MPLYYFDVHEGMGFHQDDVGDVCDDFEDAVAQAQLILPKIVQEKMPDGDWHDLMCNVRDDTGYVVYQGELTFRGRRLPSQAAQSATKKSGQDSSNSLSSEVYHHLSTANMNLAITDETLGKLQIILDAAHWTGRSLGCFPPAA